MSVQDINIESQALLNVKDSNEDERERIVVRRYKFEELRLEQIQELENDLMRYFREDLHRRLLSTDFKKQVDGIEMLQKALPSITKEIIEVLDRKSSLVIDIGYSYNQENDDYEEFQTREANTVYRFS